jgi:hypothetical protein
MPTAPVYDVTHTVTYMVAAAGNNAFIPGNCQEPTNSHDNPNNGTMVQRQASCVQLSPNAVVEVVT